MNYALLLILTSVHVNQQSTRQLNIINAASEVRIIRNDYLSLPHSIRTGTRYLTAYTGSSRQVSVPQVIWQRDEYGALTGELAYENGNLKTTNVTMPEWKLQNLVASMVLNNLSLNATVVQPVEVPGTQGRIIRFNVSDYYISRRAYQKFLEQETYFSKFTKPYSFKIIARTDWFLTNALREPHYTNLLYSRTKAPTTEAEFIKFYRFNIREVELAQRDYWAAVLGSTSIVAFNDRRLQRYTGIYDYLYLTNDFEDNLDKIKTDTSQPANKRISILKRDPIEHLLGSVDADGGELIVQMPNGLQAYCIVDKQRRIVAAASTDLVRDTKNLQNDPAVRNARSCVWCHGDGLNKPENFFSQINRLETPIDIRAYKPETLQLLDRLYTRFNTNVSRDQLLYRQAVARCNNLPASVNANFFLYYIQSYEYKGVDRAQAAFEFGCSEAHLEPAIKRSTSSRILGLMSKPDVLFPREKWERYYPAVELIFDQLKLESRRN